MSKATRSAVTRNKNEDNGYGLRRKPAVNKTKQNDTKSKLKVPKNKKADHKVSETTSNSVTRSLTKTVVSVNSKPKLTVSKTKKADDGVPETTSKVVTRRSNGIIKNSRLNESPTKKPTVLSTKLRPQRTKPWTDVSTPKTKQLDRKTRITKKTNESAIETKEESRANKIVSKSPVEIIPQELKTPLNNVSVRLERLSKRVEKLYAGKNKNKLHDNKTKEINSTPQNKSDKPTRVLRKRNNIIPNKYKDCSLNSPFFIKKIKKPDAPNPLSVFEFEFDPSEEPTKKQNRKRFGTESSDDEDSEMKNILKKIRKANVNKKQKRAKVQKKIEQVNEEPNKVPNSETKQNPVEEKQMISANAPTKQKVNKKSEVQKKIEQMNEVSNSETKQNPTQEKHMESAKQLPVKAPEKQMEPEIIHIELQPQISVNSVEMVSISDQSDPLDPLSPIDPSIQARNIVEEVTKSFIDDLSDEDSNSLSPGKFKIISNVVIRKPKKYTNKVFNSTTNGLKPSRPWRIDVSAIRKKPCIFTYKDKSFTPRYDPEVITNNHSIPSILTEKDIDKNQENTKPTFQTSILDFVKGSKPKIIENKSSGLFNDLPRNPIQSPRKVLGEINFVQSTPLKPLNNLNILKSPNVSFIKPKNKSTDGMFGFSYFSDEDENKENVRKSPRKSPKKLKPKTANIPDNEIVKLVVPEININAENNKVVKEENMTFIEPEISAAAIESDISVGLFQDIANETEVLKKSTRKYVRKHPKRKRLPSVDSIHSDDESEPERPETKKQKQKNIRTKEEEKEADRLAAHYNSMFEEMEKYPLIIE